MRTRWAGVAVVALVTGWVGTTQAAPITQTYVFKANFPTTSSGIPPYTQVAGEFTATFDPTLPSQGPFAVDSFTSNLPADYEPVVFSTIGSTAVVGDDCSSAGSCLVIGGQNTFSFAFGFNDRGLSTGGFGLTLASSQAQGVFSTTVSVGSLVPLPASAPMFGVALVALGAAGYGLKRHRGPQAS